MKTKCMVLSSRAPYPLSIVQDAVSAFSDLCTGLATLFHFTMNLLGKSKRRIRLL